MHEAAEVIQIMRRHPAATPLTQSTDDVCNRLLFRQGVARLAKQPHRLKRSFVKGARFGNDILMRLDVICQIFSACRL